MRRLLLALATLVVAAPPAAAVIQPPGTADIVALEGLNGNLDGRFKKEELITVVIRLRNDATGNLVYTNVSARLDAILADGSPDPFINIGNTSWPEPNTQESAYGTIPPNSSANGRFTLKVSQFRSCSTANQPTFQLTVAGKDQFGGTLAQVFPLPGSALPCTNQVELVPNPMPPETCLLFLTRLGSFIQFDWTPTQWQIDGLEVDSYHLYDGNLIVPRYDWIAVPGAAGIGYCGIGANVPGSLFCPCSEAGSCDLTGFHRSVTLPMGPGNRNYAVSAVLSRTSLTPGLGAEGTLGGGGAGEHFYGGGSCSPLDVL